MLTVAAKAATNDKNGNGKYSGLRRRKKRIKDNKQVASFSYFRNSKDMTMTFSNAKDPLYLAFEVLDERPLPKLMSEFVQDSFYEIAKFVSKVTK